MKRHIFAGAVAAVVVLVALVVIGGTGAQSLTVISGDFRTLAVRL